MPELVGRLAYKRSFSAEEFARLQRGLLPEQMEDKWFIVWQDDALWCHRSWTGLCVYCLRFAEDDGRHVVSEALVNRDPKQYGASDEHDLGTLDYLLTSFLAYAARFR